MIGQRIKHLREQRKWSQLVLAQKMFINNSVLSRIEAGKRDVDEYLIIKFADIFGVSTDFLLGRTENVRTDQWTKQEVAVTQEKDVLTDEETEYLRGSLKLFREIKAKYRNRS
jgi:transcriptional regulator with XRE-family HTH domain